MAIVWSAVAVAAGLRFFRDWRAGGALGLVAFSHRALDFIVHVGDLPLLFDSSQAVGLGLWGSGPGLIVSAVLELALVAGGLAIYLNWRNRNKKLITTGYP